MPAYRLELDTADTYVADVDLAVWTAVKEGTATNKCGVALMGDRVIGVTTKTVKAADQIAVVKRGIFTPKASGVIAIGDLIIPTAVQGTYKKRQVLTGVTAANAGDLFTKVAHGLLLGEQVVLSDDEAGAVPTGVTRDTVYYIIRSSADTFQLAATSALATAGTAIVISADSTGLIVKHYLGQGSLVGRSLQLTADGDIFEAELRIAETL